MLQGGVVDGENSFVLLAIDEHGHGISIKKQPERVLAPLHLGDVDAQADDASVTGTAFFNQDAAPVRQGLLVPALWVEEFRKPLGDPFLLAADGFRIVAARDADANGVLQPRAWLEQVGAAAVDLGVFLVPENVAAIRIEKHDALRQDVDRLDQPLMGFPGLGNRRFRLRPRARDLAGTVGHRAADTARQLRAWPAGPARGPGNRRTLRFLWLDWPDTRHKATHTRPKLSSVVGELSEKKVS